MKKPHTSTPPDLSEIDIDTLLTQCGQVPVIWSTEDVQNVRPDLSDDQAREVLRECRDMHDCESGFTWTLIETVADEMFPCLNSES